MSSSERIESAAHGRLPAQTRALDKTNGTTESEVWRVIEAFNRAFAQNDAESYFRFVGEEITVLTPSNPYRVEGLAADRSEFEAGLRSGATRVQFFQELQPQVRVYGDTAVVTYFSRGSYGPEGAARTAYLKETDVLVRRAGSWQVVHVHVSATA